MIILKQNIKFLEEHPAFCVLPFIHLGIASQPNDTNFTWYGSAENPAETKIITGRASSLCCSAPNPVQVDLDGSLDDIIHHEDFKQDREMFYANKLPVQCESVCNLDYNDTKRDKRNAQYIETILYENIFKKPELKIIDYNFGNECNLACRMCSASNSDQIANLVRKAVSSVDTTKKLIDFGINNIAPDLLQSTPPVVLPSKRNISDDNFFRIGILSDIKAIKKALPNLSDLQLAGGEPFVSKDVEDILLAAIETKDNEHIDLEITTNGTKFVKEKLDLVMQFRHVDMVVSIDGVGSTYDYIRYPFSFSLIEKRLRDIVDYIIENNLKEKVRLHFACVGTLYNLYNYEQLHNFLNDIFNKIIDITYGLTISDVYEENDRPHALSWDNIPIDLLNDALLSYKETQDEWYLKFKEYITNRTQDAKPDKITYAKEYTLLLDELHGSTYNDYLHPKLSKYIDSIK